MHSSTRHHRRSTDQAADTQTPETHGLILNGGWRYDLHGWLIDALLFRGQVRELRRKTIELGRLQSGEQALDVGCGTGTLALEIQRRVGKTGRVCGVDPSYEQIARARAKATQRKAPTEFQIGAIERLPFADQTFDVVFSTLMMHHLPKSLQSHGLAEIARVLKPGGRLVIADFTRKQERQGPAARFHAGGSDMQALAARVLEAGFESMETEKMRSSRFSVFPGAGFLTARKR